MDDNEKRAKMFVEGMTAGALELVAPEHRLDMEKLFQFFEKNFFRATEKPIVDGYHLFPVFMPETVKYAYDKFVPKQGDVLVCSYPKTGTTWLTEIVRNIVYVNDGDLLSKAKLVSKFYSYLEFGPVEKYRVVDNLQLPRRFLATHLPTSLINLEKFRKSDAKILYVIRNPKDQAVSWYHFALTHPFIKGDAWNKLYPENPKEFYDLYLSGKQSLFGKEGEGYLEHIKGWYEHRNDSNVMFLVYEELQKNIYSEVRKIAKFLGVKLTDEEVEKVVQNTSFKTMKEDDTVVLKFMRKGQVGEWKDELTAAQSELVDSNVARILGDTDIKFTYEE